MRNQITLNSKSYTLFRNRDGSRAWKVSARPSQPGDPSVPQWAEWNVHGPMFFSNEEPNGYLGVEFTNLVDSRWKPQAMMGPAVTSLTLSTYDNAHSGTPLDGTTAFDSDFFWDGATTAGNATCSAVIDGGGSTWMYIGRGPQLAKVNLSSLALANTGHTFPEPITSLIATRTGTGVDELSVGMQNHPYETANVINPSTSNDSWGINSSTVTATYAPTGASVTTSSVQKLCRIFGQAPGRVVGLDGGNVSSNILTGTVSMRNGNWQEVDTIDGETVVPTGFAMNGSLWMPGYDNGPYLLDPDEGSFYALIPEIDRNAVNCTAMTEHYVLGAIFNLRFGLRWQKGGSGRSWGPETFPGNRSSFQGYVTAVWANDRGEIFTALYDGTSTRILAWRQYEDDPRNPIYSPFQVHSFTGYCGFGRYVGTVNGLRTRGLHIFGVNSNAAYFSEGLYTVQPDDSGYTYNTTTAAMRLTEMRRYPHMVKDLVAVELETQGCTSNLTVTVSIYPDGVEGTLRTLNGSLTRSDGTAINGAITTNGYQRLLFVDDNGTPHSWAYGRRPKPRLEFASNSSAATPKVTGVLRLEYRLRALLAEEVDFQVVLERSEYATAEAQQDALLTEWGVNLTGTTGSGPLLVVDDPDGDTNYYVRVTGVTVTEVMEKGGGEKTAEFPVRVASVKAVKYPTTATG